METSEENKTFLSNNSRPAPRIVPFQEQPPPSQKWGNLLTLIGLATTIGSAVPVGYCIGVINSPSRFIKEWTNETLITQYDSHLSEGEIEILFSAIVSIFLVGGAIGSLGGAWAADRFGRKGCFIITGILFMIGAVLFVFCRLANSVEMLMIGRFIVGLASGLTTTALPMYLTELAPLSLRGTFGVFCAVGVTAGVVVGQVFSLNIIFGTEELWHYALCFYAVLIIICYSPTFIFPESPKYLYVIKGEREQATRELLRLRGSNDQSQVEKELEHMESESKQTTQSRSFGSVLCDPALLLPIVIVCAFQGGQQLSGINAIFYYSVIIFKQAGLSDTNAEWANLGAGCLNLATSFLGPYLMAKYNRKPLMILSTVACSLFLFATAFVLQNIDAASWLPITCIVCIFCYIFFYQFGIGPIPYFIGSELFEVSTRPVGMALGSLSSWSCNFIIGMAFPSLQRAWGAWVFIPFSITCALLFLLTKFYVPETRGKDPSDVAAEVSQGFKSKIK